MHVPGFIQANLIDDCAHLLICIFKEGGKVEPEGALEHGGVLWDDRELLAQNVNGAIPDRFPIENDVSFARLNEAEEDDEQRALATA